MSTHRTVRTGVVALLLLVLLAATGLPAHARPTPRPRPVLAQIAGIGERIWQFLSCLWNKEGMSIDPNGVVTAPNGGTDDEGMSIDPDGRS